MNYCNLPIKGAPHNKGTPIVWRKTALPKITKIRGVCQGALAPAPAVKDPIFLGQNIDILWKIPFLDL